MKKTVLGLLFAAVSCPLPETLAQPLTRWVDPFLGTGGHGHVFPGAAYPFGMVQLSPDNGVEGWDWTAGYHYSSDSIAGFSHTHLSGTGIGDWCDVSVLPLSDTTGSKQPLIRIPFSHRNESARPGYYRVGLDNGVNVQLTVTERVGIHRYHFPGSKGWVRFDLGFAINWDETTEAYFQLLNDSTLVGFRRSTGWAKNQRVYFAARFSKPVSNPRYLQLEEYSHSLARGKEAKALLEFETGGEPLQIRVAISSSGTEAALQAIDATRGKTFEEAEMAVSMAWEQELSKIRIQTADTSLATRFYTALYRTCMAPVLFSDMDGRYGNHDGQVRYAIPGNRKYTIFSLWDTFRALHPLFTITQPERTPEFMNSLLSFYRDNGLLPVWDISSWDANTMTGYHAVPVLAEAILKDVPGVDAQLAYEAMKASAFQRQRGTPDYIRYGYLPQDKHGWSVTYTLEYAYDDYCIAQVAKKLGRQDDYRLFMQRAESYRNLFDPGTGFMRGKDSTGRFIEPFDPLLSEHGFEGQYIEGTAWQHSFFVPHAVEGLARLHGGREKLVQKIDELFNSSSEMHGDNISIDVSGLIGQYAHGNEPSHHIIYMYTALGRPDKAATRIRQVVDSMYKTGPDGLSGNDDCGQMSAWLVWSSLGMYPLNPVSGEYTVGVPLVESAELTLPGGKRLKIRTHRLQQDGPAGVRKIRFNGKSMPVSVLKHRDLLKGGTLEFWVNR